MVPQAGGSVPALVRRHRPLLRDAAVASALLAALYLLGTITQSDALVLPRYFLVAVGIVEELLASAGVAATSAAHWNALVAVTLLALGSIGAGVVHLARTRADGADRSTVGVVLAAPLAVIGVLALLVAVASAVGTLQVEPVVYTSAVAAACLVLAGFLAGVVDPRAALGR